MKSRSQRPRGPPYVSVTLMQQVFKLLSQLPPQVYILPTTFSETLKISPIASYHVMRLLRFLQLIDGNGLEVEQRLSMMRLPRKQRNEQLKPLVQDAYKKIMPGVEPNIVTANWFAGFLRSRYGYGPSATRAAVKLYPALCQEVDIVLPDTFWHSS